MTEAFIVEWEATGIDQGIRSIVGPFADADAADAFAERYEMGHSAEDGYGGYSGYEIVSAEYATAPHEYAATHIERYEIDPDTHEDMTPGEAATHVAQLRAGTRTP